MSAAGGAVGTALGPALALSAGAGLLSFLSPCVLPLVPAWLSYISGYGVRDIAGGKGRGRVLSRTLAFSAGFTLVFVALGLAFAGGAQAIGGSPFGGAAAKAGLRVASGVVVALLGLNLVFDLARFLNYEKRFHPERPSGGRLAGLAGALVLGFAFAAGWSPCIGPILASILLLASDLAAGSGGVAGLGQAALLLSAYSLGLALPFIATGLGAGRLAPFLEKAKRRGRAVQVAAGLLLAALGALMASGRLGAVSGLASRAGYAIEDRLATAPGRVLAADLAAWAVLALAFATPRLAALLRARGPAAAAPGPASAADPGAAEAPDRNPAPRRHTFSIVMVSLIALAAAGEAAGLWSLARLVAGWLTFQGA